MYVLAMLPAIAGSDDTARGQQPPSRHEQLQQQSDRPSIADIQQAIQLLRSAKKSSATKSSSSHKKGGSSGKKRKHKHSSSSKRKHKHKGKHRRKPKC
jgi:hypothetical protein